MNLRLPLIIMLLACGVTATSCRTATPHAAMSACELRRGPVDVRKLALVFTGHEFAEGGEMILDQLARHRVRASFFLTGDFLARTNFAPFISRLVREGHYLGAHSDKHLLYCTWDAARTTLVSRKAFRDDLQANLGKLARFGVEPDRAKFFLPPYEHANADIARWTTEMGLTLVNYTQGTRSHADYTGESDKNFISSRMIFDSIVEREQGDPHGLNGFILLLHIGAGPGRQDKFALRFGELLDFLEAKGYGSVRIDELRLRN